MNPNSSTPTSCIWPYIPGLVGAGLGLNPSVLHVRQLVEGRVLAAFHRRASNIITKTKRGRRKKIHVLSMHRTDGPDTSTPDVTEARAEASAALCAAAMA